MLNSIHFSLYKFASGFNLTIWFRLSLKSGFGGCGHKFDGWDGLGGFNEFGGFGGFDGFRGFADSTDSEDSTDSLGYL